MWSDFETCSCSLSYGLFQDGWPSNVSAGSVPSCLQVGSSGCNIQAPEECCQHRAGKPHLIHTNNKLRIKRNYVVVLWRRLDGQSVCFGGFGPPTVVMSARVAVVAMVTVVTMVAFVAVTALATIATLVCYITQIAGTVNTPPLPRKAIWSPGPGASLRMVVPSLRRIMKLSGNKYGGRRWPKTFTWIHWGLLPVHKMSLTLYLASLGRPSTALLATQGYDLFTERSMQN